MVDGPSCRYRHSPQHQHFFCLLSLLRNRKILLVPLRNWGMSVAGESRSFLEYAQIQIFSWVCLLQRPGKDQARSSISIFLLWAGMRHPSPGAGWVDMGFANEISSKMCPLQSLLTTSLVVFLFSDLWVALGDMHGRWLRWKSIKNVTWTHKSQETRVKAENMWVDIHPVLNSLQF